MASRVLGLVSRTFGSKTPVAISTIFKILVLPTLEYAGLV